MRSLDDTSLILEAMDTPPVPDPNIPPAPDMNISPEAEIGDAATIDQAIQTGKNAEDEEWSPEDIGMFSTAVGTLKSLEGIIPKLRSNIPPEKKEQRDRISKLGDIINGVRRDLEVIYKDIMKPSTVQVPALEPARTELSPPPSPQSPPAPPSPGMAPQGMPKVPESVSIESAPKFKPTGTFKL